MTYYISESGSTGRKFDTWEDFNKALNDLANTYAEEGEEWFEVAVARN